MDDLDMQLYEAAKEFKRRDFVASICNSYVLGHIEGFSKTYQKALRILGHDEDEIRKKTIISLFEQGFEQEYVSKVLNIGTVRKCCAFPNKLIANVLEILYL